MKICKCGGSNPDEARTCNACGADLAEGGKQVSLPVQWIILGVVALAAAICLLALIVAGLVMDERDDATRVVISIVQSLVQLYAFLLALGGAFALVSKADLTRLFASPVKHWMRFLMLGAATGLLYVPLAFVFDRVFTFASRVNLVYSLERLVEGGLLILVLAGVFWLLTRRNE